MKVNFLPQSKSVHFSSNMHTNKATIILIEQKPDTFEYQDDDFMCGPFGHPYTGRPTSLSEEEVKAYEEGMSFIEWLLNPERSLYKRPKTIIGKPFSLGDNNFNDDVSKYQAELAKNALTTAKGFLGKSADISIPIGDLNGDGVVDKIVSGINKAIDITGDGKADIIGTLIDIDGDGKADFIRDQLGNLIKINGEIAKVVGDSKFKLEDLKLIPEIISSLLEK